MTNIAALTPPKAMSDPGIIDNVLRVLELTRKRRILQNILISIEDNGQIHLTVSTPSTDRHFDNLFDAFEKTFDYIINVEDSKGGGN